MFSDDAFVRHEKSVPWATSVHDVSLTLRDSTHSTFFPASIRLFHSPCFCMTASGVWSMAWMIVLTIFLLADPNIGLGFLIRIESLVPCNALWAHGNSHRLFIDHWQFLAQHQPQTNCLSLGLCKETVKESPLERMWRPFVVPSCGDRWLI